MRQAEAEHIIADKTDELIYYTIIICWNTSAICSAILESCLYVIMGC